jgi:hypothetical protein
LTVCQWFDLETTRVVFFGLTSKPVAMVFSYLTSKSLATVSLSLASKSVARVSRFVPQNRQLWFDDLGLKITATISWFGHQNQIGFGLSVAPQNRWREDRAGHASRSDGLLHLEASCVRVFQFGLKTDGGKMVSGACGIITEVVWSSS